VSKTLKTPWIDEEYRRTSRRVACGSCLVIAVVIVLVVLWQSGFLDILMDSHRLRSVIEASGFYGPLLIVGLYTIAVVINPLPSAPIAVAAGFAYGTTLGTVYTIIGSVSGAMLAFTIARLVGRDILHRWFGDKLHVGLLGSQNALTGTVFIFRLLPFISFDIVSYAAGLTAIKVWRFFLATMVGVTPVSFLLARAGSGMGSGDVKSISLTILLLGLITGIPIALKLVQDRKRKITELNGPGGST
jgi:uncharacterized membrane protein YdjX (TVP38/TMEM64 family)